MLMAMQRQLNFIGKCRGVVYLKNYFQPESLIADWLSSQALCWVCFKHLLNWLLSIWRSSVIPFSWARSLKFHRSSLVSCGLAHSFLSLGLFWRRTCSKTALYRRRQHLWRCQNCHSYIWGLPVAPMQRLKALLLPLESSFRLWFR